MAKILLIGKKTPRDYAGSKTLYAFNALTEAGLNAEVYDIHGSTDIPQGVNASIFLPWVESIDPTWAKFMKIIPGRRILYTDNWYWYDTVCGKKLAEQDIDMDSLFHVVGFASHENARWWPKSKFQWWGALVDEDLALPRKDEGYIWVDELWPKKWADGIYSSCDVLDIAIPKIKQRFGLSVLSQTPKDDDAPKPSWIDQCVPQNQEVEQMLSHLAGARAFFTAHNECLGLMQFEAMTCGVPVVTNPTMSMQETFMVPDAAHQWTWNKDDKEQDVINVEVAAERMIAAFEAAMKQDRTKIRTEAVARYGKKAFVERAGLALR